MADFKKLPSVNGVSLSLSTHTHLLANITDVGNVAAINTNGSTANYLRGDGSWVTPPNTTYTAMSETEGQTGTATNSRAMRADYLKSITEYRIANTEPKAHTHTGVDITNLTDVIDARIRELEDVEPFLLLGVSNA